MIMKTIWSKKIKWFKPPKKEIVYPNEDWTYTYENANGVPVECIIIKDKGNGYVDVLNKNGVKVFHIHTTKLQKIKEVSDDITE